jgi:5-(hydroxymethyl)furfural/furfural oxidase
VSLKSADAPEPLVEFNFAGEEVDLQRFMQGFRKAVEILAHDRVRAMSTVTFPVKFHDRLRQLNRRNTKNIVQSTIVAKLIDLVPPLAEPIFGTLADRKVNLQELVADDEALAEHIRQNVAGTFHPCGTCRMSDDMGDRQAVTDTKGRLRGFEGVRVVDASLMPTAPRGNTFVPTVMLAEKMSAAIGVQ